MDVAAIKATLDNVVGHSKLDPYHPQGKKEIPRGIGPGRSVSNQVCRIELVRAWRSVGTFWFAGSRSGGKEGGVPGRVAGH